jgi:hypothetical protein
MPSPMCSTIASRCRSTARVTGSYLRIVIGTPFGRIVPPYSMTPAYGSGDRTPAMLPRVNGL